MSRSARIAVLVVSLAVSALFAVNVSPALAAAPPQVSARVGSHPFIGTSTSDAVARALGLPAKASITSTSTNWSGYSVMTAFPTGANNAFSDVKGTWVVPTVTAGPTDAYSANWVGIDGYQSTTVEQLGTECDSIGGVPFYSAWWEMYPGGSVRISSLSVHPGDVMAAEVLWISGNQFQLSMTNVTRSLTFTTTQTQQGGTALRSSAEWIVEAPSSSSGILPLANITSSTFTSCTAVGNGVTGPINGSGWQYNAMTLADSSGNALQVPSVLTAAGTSFVMAKPGAASGDTVAPTTTSDAVASYNNTALIHLTATDNTGGSGVASTFYQLDGGATTAGTSVSVTTYGSHTLRFWSVDNAGNTETANAVTFFVNDTIAPTTTSNVQASYVGTATIALTATDNTGGSGVASTHYSVDGGSFVAGTQVTVTTIGNHTLAFFSTDLAGNQEATWTVGFTVTTGAAARLSRLSKLPTGPQYVLVRHHGVARWTFGAALESAAGAPIAGLPVVLQRSANGVAWTGVTTVMTSSTGQVAAPLTFRGAGVGYWRWLFAGNASWAAASTSRTRVTVR